MEAQLHQGLVEISDYKDLLQTELFSRMENFSNNFVTQNSEALSAYSRKWITDPLHQWSRQWEYPFVSSEIQKYVSAHSNRPTKILDAGSGITFFSYFLEETVRGAELTCCDTDAALQDIYGSVNTQTGHQVKFLCEDIRSTGFENDSFDIIYCVSVLEHTKNYEEIVKEFVRILKDDGILIVTFDISLDGRSDIPISEVKKLVVSLQNYLLPTDRDSIVKLLDENRLLSSKIITTPFVWDWDKSLLPWKYP